MHAVHIFADDKSTGKLYGCNRTLQRFLRHISKASIHLKQLYDRIDRLKHMKLSLDFLIRLPDKRKCLIRSTLISHCNQKLSCHSLQKLNCPVKACLSGGKYAIRKQCPLIVRQLLINYCSYNPIYIRCIVHSYNQTIQPEIVLIERFIYEILNPAVRQSQKKVFVFVFTNKGKHIFPLCLTVTRFCHDPVLFCQTQ